MKKEKKYIEIYNKLKDKIKQNDYKYNDKLPSKRVIASIYGASLITVEHAILLLESEGYIEAKQRRGYFVTYKASEVFFNDDISSMLNEDIKITKTYSIKEKEYEFPISQYIKAVRKVLIEEKDKIFIPSEPKGLIRLREEIASYLKRNRNICVSLDQIIISSASEHLYTIVSSIFGRDYIFGIENPSYEKIRKTYELNGIRVELLEMGNNGIKSKDLKNTNAMVLHVTPYKSFPSKITSDASKRMEYIKWAKKRGAYIVEDDYASEFSMLSKMEDTLFSLAKEDNVIYLNSFTKTISRAIRIGYMILPKKLIKVYEEKLSFYSCTVPVLEQMVLSKLLRNGAFERHLNKVRRKNREKNKII